MPRVVSPSHDGWFKSVIVSMALFVSTASRIPIS